MNQLLFRTIHGSRLYGLNHENSDYDWFEVYGWEKGRSKQKITGDTDTVRTSIDSFLWNASRGVPQFVEAMFAQSPEVNKIEHLRSAWRPGMAECRDTYKRTIKGLWIKGVEEDKVKFRQHALRLYLNLHDLETDGRFNPTLTKTDIMLIKEYAVGTECEMLGIGLINPRVGSYEV